MNEQTLSYIEKYKEKIKHLGAFEEKLLEDAAHQLAEELGVDWAKIIHPIRVAVTGSSASPGIFLVLVLLGKEKAIKRLENAKNLL